MKPNTARQKGKDFGKAKPKKMKAMLIKLGYGSLVSLLIKRKKNGAQANL